MNSCASMRFASFWEPNFASHIHFHCCGNRLAVLNWETFPRALKTTFNLSGSSSSPKTSGYLNFRMHQGTFAQKVTKEFKVEEQTGGLVSDASRRLSEFRSVVWRFLRPHTIYGTVVGSVALVARALLENSNNVNWYLLPKALYGLLALICGNGYIVGLNQIYDIRIDQLNKPYLPLAAGDLKVLSAWMLVLGFAFAGLLVVGLTFGPFISSLYCLGLFLGSIYSVPPFRLKRFPVAAVLVIAMVRGFLINFSVYYATVSSLGLPFTWSSPVGFITAFGTLFASVIAITKDLPDVDGDSAFLIATFARKLGVRSISYLGCGLLLANYVGAMFVAICMPKVLENERKSVNHNWMWNA